LHIGTARTALFNYLFAKATGGIFMVRIEDTDKARNKPEYEKNIIESIHWLGMEWDEFYRQSEQVSNHTKALKKLIVEGKAYVSKENSKIHPGETVEVVRLKNAGSIVAFEDVIHGTIKTDTTDLGDFVIARAIDDPLYHLAVVVDDGETGITHIIRGDDHISNTARQILILEALGYTRPQYAHVPLILAPNRSKMSKRDGATAIDEYKNLGFLPDAVVNYLALMGWNPGTPQEIFTLEELVKAFHMNKFQKGGAIFDMTKFLWYNREHIKRLSDDAFAKQLSSFGVNADPRLIPLLHDRVHTFGEARELLASDEFSFLGTITKLDAGILVPIVKGEKGSVENTKSNLQKIYDLLSPLVESRWTSQSVKELVWPYAEIQGKSNVLWPMRVALTGKEKSPDPFTVSGLIGKNETLTRLHTAIEAL
jgi:glutamyl-tRNA synthetase